MDDSELYIFLNNYNWEIIENQIYKKFVFKNFGAATKFYNLIASIRVNFFVQLYILIKPISCN